MSLVDHKTGEILRKQYKLSQITPDEECDLALYLHDIAKGKICLKVSNLIRSSAKRGSNAGKFNLAVFIVNKLVTPPGSLKEAEQILISLVHKVPAAQEILARGLFHGMFGRPPDKERAILYWISAADQGCPEACVCLSICYLHGDLLEKDVKLSFGYFQVAKEQKDMLKAELRATFDLLEHCFSRLGLF